MRDAICRAVNPLEDPTANAADAVPPISDHDLNTRPAVKAALRPAAVLVPLVRRPGGLTVLLTRRTEHLHDHAGQVSFPGGRIEPEDRDALAAALRETHEEIGLDESWIEPVGTLDDYETVTGYRVTPVVAFVEPGFTLDLDDFEVAEAFEVPLAFILDPANHRIDARLRGSEERRFYVFEYDRHYIWGATAGMLVSLCRRIRAAGGEP